MATDVSTLQAQKTKLDNIYAELDALYEKYLDKADGNVMQRSSNRRFAKLFNPASGEINEDKTIKEKDIREAINRYRKATEPAQKLAAANNFRDLWEAAGEDITENPTFKGAYNLINNMSPEEFEE